MSLIHPSPVACRECQFAALTGVGFFDWYRFPLGGVRYWVVGFYFCMECGVTHCNGSRRLTSGERSGLFAQPGPLFLVKRPVTIWRGDREYHEEQDAIEVAAWLPCHASPDGARPERKAEDGVLYAGEYSCGACKVPGTLVGLLDQERLWRCPLCRRQSLGRSYASVAYEGLEFSIEAEAPRTADRPHE